MPSWIKGLSVAAATVVAAAACTSTLADFPGETSDSAYRVVRADFSGDGCLDFFGWRDDGANILRVAGCNGVKGYDQIPCLPRESINEAPSAVVAGKFARRDRAELFFFWRGPPRVGHNRVFRLSGNTLCPPTAEYIDRVRPSDVDVFQGGSFALSTRSGSNGLDDIVFSDGVNERRAVNITPSGAAEPRFEVRPSTAAR